MIVIHDEKYKGERGVCLENDLIRAVILPEHGSRLCSLILKKTGYEYIYQGKSHIYRCSEYGQNFLEGECAGVDEMFPNIDAGYYVQFPWNGVFLPDHGEVWARPWNYRQQGEKVRMSIYGAILPCRLEKTVTLQNGTLHMEYELENLTEFPMDYIWAAHMMLSAREGSRFEFAPSLAKAYVTMSDSKTIGSYGDTFSYPCVETDAGEIYDIRVHRGNGADDYQKFYFADRLGKDQGWGKIHHPDGSCLCVSFPPEEIPYLGVIQAEGGSLDIDCMFLEPCTGAFDSPSEARMHHMYSVLGGRETKRWFLDIRITDS